MHLSDLVALYALLDRYDRHQLTPTTATSTDSYCDCHNEGQIKIKADETMPISKLAVWIKEAEEIPVKTELTVQMLWIKKYHNDFSIFSPPNWLFVVRLGNMQGGSPVGEKKFNETRRKETAGAQWWKKSSRKWVISCSNCSCGGAVTRSRTRALEGANCKLHWFYRFLFKLCLPFDCALTSITLLVLTT